MNTNLNSKQTNSQGAGKLKALIVATQMTEGSDPVPCALMRVCGISLLERQVRQLRNIGVGQITVLAQNDHPDLSAEINRLKKLKVDISLHRTGQILIDVSPGADWMLMDGASLIDFRLPDLIKQTTAERVTVVPLSELTDADAARGVSVDWPGQPVVFAGCARLKSDRLALIRPDAENGWLERLLSEIIRNGSQAAVDIAALPSHIHDMRRDLPYYWFPVRNKTDSRRGKALLIDAAHKEVVDWPALFIHRPIENWIVKHICEWPITPNQISLICNIVAYFAAYHFAFGSLGWAILGALSVGILDGVDGMQARVKQMMSRFGGIIEHVCDSIYEYVWQYAMAYRLMTEGHGAAPIWMACFIVGVDMAEKVLLNLFERKRGVSLNVYSPFDRAFRVVVGRRDNYMWALIPFVVFDALWAGYWMLVIYALLTLLERTWRVGYVLIFKR